MSDLTDAVIQQHLKTLKMPGMKREYQQLARHAVADSWPYQEYLRELLDIEIRILPSLSASKRPSVASACCSSKLPTWYGNCWRPGMTANWVASNSGSVASTCC